ncbi:hypothetical protein OROMI_016305 [Orobanche minor]
MDEKGKYLLSLGSGALLGSAATLATSKLLLRQSGRECANVDFIDSNGYMFKTSDSSLKGNSTDKTANYIEVLGIHLKGVNFARLSPLGSICYCRGKWSSAKYIEEDLYQILAEWGPIRHIRVIKERRYGISRGFAFVDFPSMGAAQTMMDRFGHEGLLVDDSL